MSGLAGKHVLVVEDEPIIAFSIEDMLHELGCVVVGPAGRLRDGLRLATEAAIDLAILDLNLAGERSYPIADMLAQRGIPYVFASGYGQVPEQRDGHGAYLEKPYYTEQVKAALEGLLES